MVPTQEIMENGKLFFQTNVKQYLNCVIILKWITFSIFKKQIINTGKVGTSVNLVNREL